MAKKAVATLHEGSTDGRAYTKVIKMVKSFTEKISLLHQEHLTMPLHLILRLLVSIVMKKHLIVHQIK